MMTYVLLGFYRDCTMYTWILTPLRVVLLCFYNKAVRKGSSKDSCDFGVANKLPLAVLLPRAVH